MKTMTLSLLAFAAMASTALAGPQRLTDAQMDGITAGLAGISVTAIAVAVGTEGALATTTTKTFAKGTKRVDIARGSGSAFASGDLFHDAVVSTQLFAEGDRVIGRTFSREVHTEEFSAARGGGFVIAIDLPNR